MSNATELYKAGKLPEAVAAALEAVKAAPADRGKRFFLAELLVFSGDLERADKQLDVLFKPDAQDLPMVTLFRQLIRAETARREFYTQGRVPEFLKPPSDCVKLHLEASINVREGKLAEAAALIAKAEDSRPRVAGTCDDKPFDEIRDLDDLTAPVIEVLTANGTYYHIPWESIELIEFHAPERARDLYWRPAHMVVTEGPDGIVYVPALYHGSHAEVDNAFKLGRGTDYRGGDGTPFRGTGQRELMVGEDALPILGIREIEFTK
jgi:type VI secretion system protein ImpE